MNLEIEQKLSNYKTPEAAKKLIRNSRLVFLVGISGAGKDTVQKKLLVNPEYHHIVTHTTRQPRENNGVMETNGVEYHFISFEEARDLLDNGGYVEAKMFSGNIYGTSVAEIEKATSEGKIAIGDIEVQGIAEYRAISDNVIPIFLLPPDFQTWQDRFMKRYVENELTNEEFRKRMNTAKAELTEALHKPYFEFVVNNDLELTVKIVDEVAHGHFSEKKNAEAKAVAAQLLRDLEEFLTS